MSTRRFEARTAIPGCTAEAVFDWIADYRNVPKVLEGVSRWEPLTRRTTGVGARFSAEMRTLGVGLSSDMELVSWDRPHLIGWRSEGGLVEQEGRWEITQDRDDVDVVLVIEYVPPAAAVGNLLARPVEALAQRRLQAALDRLGDEVCGEET